MRISRDHLRFIELLVSRNDRDPSSIEIEDQGRGYYLVRLFDKSSVEVGQHVVQPYDNELPY